METKVTPTFATPEKKPITSLELFMINISDPINWKLENIPERLLYI